MRSIINVVAVEAWLFLVLCVVVDVVDAFVLLRPQPMQQQFVRLQFRHDNAASDRINIDNTKVWSRGRATTMIRYNFFKDMIEEAFANDGDLLSRGDDKRTGAIEGPNNESGNNDEPPTARTLTATQKQWRDRLAAQSVPQLAGTSFEVDLFLTGVPNKDPSNDLYGSRVNISSRDRRVGQALPEKPTVPGARLTFLSGEKNQQKVLCRTDSKFTAKDEVEGDWIMSSPSSSGNSGTHNVRFRIPVTGFSRTVQTKGTIQKINWSKEEGQSRETSTTYSIPEGWLYGEAQVSVVSVSGGNNNAIQWTGGVLNVEQSKGLLGAGSRMVPCGAFTARPATTSSDTITNNSAASVGAIITQEEQEAKVR